MTTSQHKVIYDIGSHNGDDLPYYLKKSDIVIAIEANSSLCSEIKKRFSTEITNGKLFVENCVLTADDSVNEVFFYISKDSQLSQFPKPDESIIGGYEKVLLPSKSVLSVIEKYGDPYYIKVDIEHYDGAILKALFLNNIRPPFISAESHSIEVFSLLVTLGKYNAFKLVDGFSVSQEYNNHLISLEGRQESYSFPFHSAGPFGEDISGEWMTADNFLRLLAFEGLGWKDIHATNVVKPNPLAYPKLDIRKVIETVVRGNIKPVIPRPIWLAITKTYRRLF